MTPQFYHFRGVPWFRPFLVRRPDGELPACRAENGRSAVSHKENEQLVARLLSKLPESQCLAFVLFEIDGHTSEEIAGLTGVPIDTVSTRIHKARTRLASKLEQLRVSEASLRGV